MLSTSPLWIAVLLSVSTDVIAAPQPRPRTTGTGVMSMDLKRRVLPPKTLQEKALWAKSHRELLHTKYGRVLPGGKRSSGTNLLVNQGTDSSFYGSLAIGTPAVSYNVILDTGSADMWIADSSCISGCDSIPTFDTADSSSYTNSSESFSITYGSGAAAGVLGSDTIQMAGFSVSNQIFAVCDQVSSGLLSDPISGLLGLAWKTIASSGATPFWQALVSGGAWDSPLMAFQLTRYLNVNGASQLENGGSFTMGATNSSLFTGDIEYIDLVDDGSYWMIPITSLTAQGSSATIGSGTDAYAAIDTGTTLVGGPSDQIASFYSLIPDATAGTGNYEGYYLYPCDTTVNVTVSFGGKSWTISNDDFLLQQVSNTECVGAFFEFSGGNSGPAWIFGDTFLKNVYSVFRYDTPAVGFAELSTVASAMNGNLEAEVPSATIGSVAAAVSATSTNSRNSNAGLKSSPSFAILGAIVAAVVFNSS